MNEGKPHKLIHESKRDCSKARFVEGAWRYSREQIPASLAMLSFKEGKGRNKAVRNAKCCKPEAGQGAGRTERGRVCFSHTGLAGLEAGGLLV